MDRSRSPWLTADGRPHRKAVLRVAVVVLAVALALGSCSAVESGSEANDGSDRSGGAGSSAGGTPDTERAERNTPPVPTAIAEVTNRAITVEVGGRLEPRRRISHRVPVAGIVQEVAVSAGERVREGDVLYTIERNEVGQTFRPIPVTSRVSGVASDISLGPAEQVASGDPGVVVVDASGFRLEAKVSDKDAGGVRIGEVVTARTSDDEELTGRLTSRSEEPDYETGLFSVSFEFPNAPGVGIGTFLLVSLPTERIDGIFVPRASVDRRYGRYFVWTIDEAEEVLVRTEVRLGRVWGDEVQVVSGLERGTRYLLRPRGEEREGDPAPPRPDGA